MKHLANHSECVLGTRASEQVYQAVKIEIPDCIYRELSRIIVVGKCHRSDEEIANDINYIAVLCAGTADLPVAEEAAIVAGCLGSKVVMVTDVGVAGLHRLLDKKEVLFGANVLIVVAGMEGALPSVVAGLVDRPVIAVPTSVGYGASFNGLSALLTMLNSCAAGIGVVNIDNGFGSISR